MAVHVLEGHASSWPCALAIGDATPARPSMILVWLSTWRATLRRGRVPSANGRDPSASLHLVAVFGAGDRTAIDQKHNGRDPSASLQHRVPSANGRDGARPSKSAIRTLPRSDGRDPSASLHDTGLVVDLEGHAPSWPSTRIGNSGATAVRHCDFVAGKAVFSHLLEMFGVAMASKFQHETASGTWQTISGWPMFLGVIG